MKIKRITIYALMAIILVSGVLVILSPSITGLSIFGNCDYPGKDVRPLYFDCKTQNEMFGELPEMPEDFYETRSLFLYKFIDFTNKITDFRYWKQPEWFPTYASAGGTLDAIRDYIQQSEKTGIWGTTVWCAGIYPSDFYVKTRAGQAFTVYTWIRNAPHQNKYEGINLKESYPVCDFFEERGFELGNNTVCQDPEYAKEHIDIKFTPDLFLLTPNFPVYTTDHTRMITVKINVSESIAPGRYVVGFDTKMPSEDFNRNYYAQYGFTYTGSEKEFHCAPGPQYRLFLDIEA